MIEFLKIGRSVFEVRRAQAIQYAPMSCVGPSGRNVEDDGYTPGLHVARGIALVLPPLADRQRHFIVMLQQDDDRHCEEAVYRAGNSGDCRPCPVFSIQRDGEEYEAIDDGLAVIFSTVCRCAFTAQHRNFIIGQLEQETDFVPMIEQRSLGLEFAFMVNLSGEIGRITGKCNCLCASIAEGFKQPEASLFKRDVGERPDSIVNV